LAAGHTGKAGAPAAGNELACLTCHGTGGAAATKPFAFGGRVINGGQPAANIDVQVVSGGATLGPVKSDDAGFYWLALTTPIADGAKAYARSDKAEAAMSTPLTAGAGSCDAVACHGNPAQGNVHVP
jgi:hypothetical protein